MKNPPLQAESFIHAIEQIAWGYTQIISRIPVEELTRRAALVRDGLLDFDGTLVTGNTWVTIAQQLPDDLRQKDTAIREWYWQQLHAPPTKTSLEDPDWYHGHMMTSNQAVVDGAWIANDIHWYMQAGLTRRSFEAVAQTLPVRQGACRLLEHLRHKAVITFGIEQVVQDWLGHRGIGAAVAGTRLTFDETGRLTGHHPNVVASTTKALAARRFLHLTGSSEAEMLVLGDTVVDVHMMAPNSFNVLIVPPSELDQKLPDFRKRGLSAMWDRITMILADDSLEPLVDLLQEAQTPA